MYEAMMRDMVRCQGGYSGQKMPRGGQDYGVPGSIKHRGKKKGKGKKKRK